MFIVTFNTGLAIGDVVAFSTLARALAVALRFEYRHGIVAIVSSR